MVGGRGNGEMREENSLEHPGDQRKRQRLLKPEKQENIILLI